MKKYLLIAAVAIIGLAGCKSNSSEVKDFIPGTYVNHVKGEYGSADDTLVISSKDDIHYYITRNTGYTVIRHGQALPSKRQVQHLFGTYDAASQTLTETTKGRSFTFAPKTGTLTTNRGGVYQKLK